MSTPEVSQADRQFLVDIYEIKGIAASRVLAGEVDGNAQMKRIIAFRESAAQLAKTLTQSGLSADDFRPGFIADGKDEDE